MDGQSDRRNRRLIQAAKAVFRVAVLTLVTWGIWRTVEKAVADFRRQQSELQQRLDRLDEQLAKLPVEPGASAAKRDALAAEREQLQRQRFSLRQIQPWWLAASGCFYLLGSVPCWLFWHRTLRLMGQRPSLWETLRAYYIGHLGKYVPGKAFVVVLRSALLGGRRVDLTVAATSVFIETLTMMAVGALVAAAALAARRHEDPRLFGLAIGLMICVGLPTLPPVLRRLVRLLQVRRASPEIDGAVSGLNCRLMFMGWTTIAVGWCVFGLSLWALLRAMPTAAQRMADPKLLDFFTDTLPLLTACAALAVVAGFLSLLPAGAGVREYVMMTLLAPAFGHVAAVVSAVLLRLVWMASEVLVSVILYPCVRRPERGRREPSGQPEAPA